VVAGVALAVPRSDDEGDAAGDRGLHGPVEGLARTPLGYQRHVRDVHPGGMRTDPLDATDDPGVLSHSVLVQDSHNVHIGLLGDPGLGSGGDTGHVRAVAAVVAAVHGLGQAV